MCGITGIFHFEKNRSVSNTILKKMCDIITHRGPDNEGFYINNYIGLAHRRLSIIDLDTGTQPMFNSNKTIALIFNGEIYNFIELREELKSLGYLFHTDSDTEVIINAYEAWGVDCQNKFNGMWAFALWDVKKETMFISRDRIGQKPLYYSEYDNSVLFGSEIKTIFEYGHPKEYRLDLIELYLVLNNIPEPYTFFKNIKKLKAGHYLLIKDGVIKEKQYWTLPNINEKNMITDKKLIYDKFTLLFKDSIKKRMQSDVPYGAFLSGGLDSSAIVSIMAEISKFPINTFTIGFDNKEYDESSLAQEVATKYNTNHHKGTITEEQFEALLETVLFHTDEPFGDSSTIPTGQVSKFATDKVKMVLTGDGGDELLSGYPSYQSIKFSNYYKKLPTKLRSWLPSIIKNVSKPLKGSIKYKINRLYNVLNSSNKNFNDMMIDKRSSIPLSVIRNLTKNLPKQYKIEDWFDEIMKDCTYKDDFYKLMYFNYKHSLPNQYLVKVDRMSMANSLETRSPFLDYRLIEFMVQVDKNVKMQGWERKSILRNTIGKTLPYDITHAPKKGFVVPLREWFKGDSIVYNVSNLNKNLDLDKKIIKKIIDDNKTSKRDNGNFIWMLLLLNNSIKK